jgi:hypothetical protein
MNPSLSQKLFPLNENIAAGWDLATVEVLALCYRYEGSFYTFEYGQRCVNARFLTAYPQATCYQPVNGYRIELVAAADLVVDGVCVIRDIQGHLVNAWVSTRHGTEANLITIEATAL